MFRLRLWTVLNICLGSCVFSDELSLYRKILCLKSENESTILSYWEESKHCEPFTSVYMWILFCMWVVRSFCARVFGMEKVLAFLFIVLLMSAVNAQPDSWLFPLPIADRMGCMKSTLCIGLGRGVEGKSSSPTVCTEQRHYVRDPTFDAKYSTVSGHCTLAKLETCLLQVGCALVEVINMLRTLTVTTNWRRSTL